MPIIYSQLPCAGLRIPAGGYLFPEPSQGRRLSKDADFHSKHDAMTDTPRARQLTRLTSTRDSAPESLEVAVLTSATDITAVFERCVHIAEDTEPGCLKSAGGVSSAIGLTSEGSAESETFLATVYAKITAQTGTCTKALPADDTTGRAKLKTFLLLLLQQNKAEVKALSEAGRLSPVRLTAAALTLGDVADSSASTVTMKSKKDQEDEYLSKLMAYEQKHRPKSQQWPAVMHPSRAMILLFDKFTVASSPPSLPQAPNS